MAWEERTRAAGNGTTEGSAKPVAVSGLSNGVHAIAAGEQHSLALKSGVLDAWGNNGTGQLGDGTTENKHTWRSEAMANPNSPNQTLLPDALSSRQAV